MDIDELRSAQSRERQASSLQHLRDSFYEEAAEFIRGLRAERERVAERSEHSFPSDDPEVKRLTNEIDTAEEVVEALYERRVGKVVKKASFAAADMNVDDEGLTTEERELFETLVGNIEANRASVLDALTGDTPTGGNRDTASATGAEPAAGGPTPEADTGGEAAGGEARNAAAPRDAAPDDAAPDDEPTYRIGEAGPATSEDLTTGGGDEAGAEAPASAAPTPEGPDGTPPVAPEGNEPAAGTRDDPRVPDADPEAVSGRTGSDGMDAASAMGLSSGDDPTDDRHAVPPEEAPAPDGPAAATDPASGDPGGPPGTEGRAGSASAPDEGVAADDTGGDAGSGPALTVVRITEDIGEIFAVDDRSYDLSAGDVVSLPAVNAKPLLDGDAAERVRPAVEPGR